VKENEIDWTCREMINGERQLGRPRLCSSRIVLKWFFEKWALRVWIALD
jgi:hypothetical protein